MIAIIYQSKLSCNEPAPDHDCHLHQVRVIVEWAARDSLTPHDLRHETMTRLFELGLKVTEIPVRTGHKRF